MLATICDSVCVEEAVAVISQRTIRAKRVESTYPSIILVKLLKSMFETSDVSLFWRGVSCELLAVSKRTIMPFGSDFKVALMFVTKKE